MDIIVIFILGINLIVSMINLRVLFKVKKDADDFEEVIAKKLVTTKRMHEEDFLRLYKGN